MKFTTNHKLNLPERGSKPDPVDIEDINANTVKLDGIVGGLRVDHNAHASNKENPHDVTKEQVKLGNVNNTADADKPVSAPQKAYIDAADRGLGLHIDDVAADVQILAETKENTANKGEAGGYASLDDNGKVPLAQINDALLGNVSYQGLWDAAANTPSLSAAAEVKGHYYIVTAGGTQFGVTYHVGDWAISDGATWDKVDNTDTVTSVAGRTGNVALTKADVGLGNAPNEDWKTASLTVAADTATNGTADTTARTGTLVSLFNWLREKINWIVGSSGLGAKANTADVLTKTNTTSYTPGANYHPATKKYVDDAVGAAGGGDMLKATYDANNSGVVDNAEKVNGLTVQTAVPVSAKFTDTTYSAATTSASGLMSYSDKAKLDGVATGANNYSLPAASSLAATLKAEIAKLFWPVGALYFSTANTNPNSILGMGTWVAWGQGRVPLGVDSIAANTVTTYGSVTAGAINRTTAEERGGELGHTLTVAEIAPHIHPGLQYGGQDLKLYISNYNTRGMSMTGMEYGASDIVTKAAGGGGAHNNIQPYITCYMWKRTA